MRHHLHLYGLGRGSIGFVLKRVDLIIHES